MGKRLEGNGDSQVKILLTDDKKGHITIAPDDLHKLAELTPICISKTLGTWLKKNPACRIRCTLPIVNEGMTIIVHVWYDRLATVRKPPQPKPTPPA